MTDNSDRKRGAADILDQQSQIDHFADPARNLEVAFDAGAYQIRVSDQSQNGLSTRPHRPKRANRAR